MSPSTELNPPRFIRTVLNQVVASGNTRQWLAWFDEEPRAIDLVIEYLHKRYEEKYGYPFQEERP